MAYRHKYARELEKTIILASKNPKLLRSFLHDLLSPAERAELSVRWQIVRQLAAGIPQREIAKNLKVSIATVTRGSRELADKNGGFYKILVPARKNKPVRKSRFI